MEAGAEQSGGLLRDDHEEGMSDHWECYPCMIDKKPASIFVDIGIRETIDRDAPSRLAKFRLAFKHTHLNGLPTGEDYGSAVAIEELIEQFTLRNDDWYVGHISVSGHCNFYIYTKLAEQRWDKLVAATMHETGYDVTVILQDDPDHRCYWDRLFPTMDDWQVISDLKVINELAKSGENGMVARQIDHWVYFKDQKAAEPFIHWAKSDGFAHITEYSAILESGQYCVRLAHHGCVLLTDISGRTIMLNRKAAEFGGHYGGWDVAGGTS